MQGGFCAPSGWSRSCSCGFGSTLVDVLFKWSCAALKAATREGVHSNSLTPLVWSWAVALSKGSMRDARLGSAGRSVLYSPLHELTAFTVRRVPMSVCPRLVRI